MEVLEQSPPIWILLLLLLLYAGHLLSHAYLPLCMIVYRTLYGSICLFNGCKSVVEAVVGLLRVMIPSAREIHATSLGSLLKMRILEGAPPIVVLPLVVPPSSAKPVLVLNLILI